MAFKLRVHALAPTILVALLACSSVEDQIEQVTKGGDEGKAATMRLLLAPDDVTPQIIAAAQSAELSFEERLALLNLLHRFHVREADQRIAEMLRRMTGDPDARTRRAVVRIIGDVGQKDQLSELTEMLQNEGDEQVLQQTVTAVSRLGKWRIGRSRGYWVEGGQFLESEQRFELEQLIKQTYLRAQTDSLRFEADEFLQKLACQIVQEAEQRVLSGDLSGAATEFQRALDLVPHSLDVRRRFGKFKLDHLNGKRVFELTTKPTCCA